MKKRYLCNIIYLYTMSKKDKIETFEVDDVNLLPELLDGKHHVIPIVTGGDEPVEEVEVPEIIPILTLRSSVLFPGAITPITVGRDKSINLVRAVNAEGGILGAVLQRESDVEDPAPDDMYKVGTAARIIKILEMPNGNLTVILNGLEKVEITEYITTEPYFKARVTALRDSTPDLKSIEFEALVDSIRDVALNIINVSPSMPKEAAFAIKNIDSKRGIINFICSNMELTDEDRQSLLEAPGLLARARKLLEILIREQQLAELKSQIQERVKQEIDKQQRDYYLQQQMRTIQDELGDGADADIEKMREAAKKKNWPKEVGETFEKELQKVERLNPAVAEYSVQMTYLQLLLELPWNDMRETSIDIPEARAILDADHFGLEKPKQRILEFLAVQKLTNALKGPILCLVGPPGVGKTSLARSVATATGREYVRLSLGGVRDEAEIRGHRRTYVGAMPGKIIMALKRAKSSNPLFCLDEIDKMSSDYRGDPASALLEVLDPEQNKTFNDHYLDIDYDLSKVFFITTANSLHNIPAPLQDRMEIIELSSYLEVEKKHIARDFLLPRQIKEHGLKPGNISLPEETLTEVIRSYTREAGVRSLEREIGALCRKTAIKLVEEDNLDQCVTITPEDLETYLGVKKYRMDENEKSPKVGVVNGLAYTGVGGVLLNVETVIMPGKGNVATTGKIGEVMSESAKAALSYVRSRAAALGLKPDFHSEIDIHTHFPEGATPKDGPSAGIAITTSLVSALLGIPVRHDVAMTGEVTLRGRVLPIGGLREKLLAASRAEMATVIIPRDNAKDLKEVPDEILQTLRIELVDHVDEVLPIALDAPEDAIWDKSDCPSLIESLRRHHEPAVTTAQ